MSRRKRWLWIVAAVVAMVALDQGLAILAGSGWLHGALTRRLAAAFGRPVEVSRYSFSLWPAPRLEAEYVTVGEDPRFGQEYFLRAEAVEASARWQSLLRGRLEFDRFAFRRPSLNLVRNGRGRWNLEDWLPAPAAPGQPAARTLRRLDRMEISEGRINFKQGVEKSAFALVDVNGSIEQEAHGRFRIDLEALPMRAAVIVQDVGQLEMRGVVGGTSARLRPAAIELTWRDTALSDVLRLTRGWDYGVRGRLEAELAATSQGADWAFTATARLTDLHRWDLPLLPGDPAVNLHLKGDWWPEAPGGAGRRLVLSEGVVEAPRSSIRLAGVVNWPGRPGEAPADVARLQAVSAGIGYSDLLAWYRAFHRGVSANLAAEGQLGLDAQLTGWPPRIAQGVVATDGGRITGAAPGPFQLGHAIIRFDPKGATLAPVTISLPKQAGRLELAGRLAFASGGPFHLRLDGSTTQLADLSEAAAALGIKQPPVWGAVEGPAALRLAWEGQVRQFTARTEGEIDLANALWRAPRSQGSVRLERVRVELGPEKQRILVRRAEALGAGWSGWVSRRIQGGLEPWRFELKADSLPSGALAALFAAPPPESFWARILPGGQRPTEIYGWMKRLDAQGRLTIDTLALGSLQLHRLRGRVSMDPEGLRLDDARADFYRGSVRGAFDMRFSSPPAYRATARFDHVSLGQLAGAEPALAGRFAGMVSGDLRLAARGASREELVRSVEGRGQIALRDAEDRRLDWFASLAAGGERPGTTAFGSAFAAFHVAGGRIGLDDVRLDGSARQLELAGSISFSRGLDVRVRTLPLPAQFSRMKRLPAALVSQAFALGGTLTAPEIRRVPFAPPAR
jgi:AsmA-like C-terminal region/AsmA family